MKDLPAKNTVPFICVALLVVTIATFQQVRNNDFVAYDDTVYVTENPYINAGISTQSVVWAFTKPYASTWNPLASLSHMLDCELFGLNPAWHHIVSLLFHAASAILLFVALKGMTERIWPSAFVAAAFALHPLRVESVAWVAERKDVLSVFFAMLTLWLYARYTKYPNLRKYLLVVVAFVLGLLSKPMLITLPFVLLLLDYWPLGRLRLGRRNMTPDSPSNISPKYVIVEKIPLLALMVVSCVVTYFVQESGGALSDIYPFRIRLMNALVSYVAYIEKMIYPARLAVLYPHPGSSLPMYKPILAALILTAVSVLVFLCFRQRYLTVGWLWYLGTLIPIIGLVQTGSHAMADRFVYLPSIGLIIIAAWGAEDVFKKFPYHKTILPLLAASAIVAMMICTRLQIRHWKDTFSLFKRAAEVTKNNYIMHTNYGALLTERRDYEKALYHLEEALRIKPDFSDAYNNLGLLLADQGKTNEAAECYQQALVHSPNNFKAVYNLGNAYLKMGRLDAASAQYKKAIELNPDSPEAHYNMGYVSLEMRRFNDAVTHYKRVLELKPDWYQARANLNTAQLQQENLEKTIAAWTESLKKNPNQSLVHSRLGAVFELQGDINQAVYHWNMALKLEPDSPDVLNNLAWIKANPENQDFYDPARAVQLAERACELTGRSNAALLDTLAAAYAEDGRIIQAIRTAEDALKLARLAGQQKLAAQIQDRINFYKQNQ